MRTGRSWRNTSRITRSSKNGSRPVRKIILRKLFRFIATASVAIFCTSAAIHDHPVASSAQSSTGITAITGVTLIDGSGRRPIRDATVLIQGDSILAAGHGKRIRIPAGARIIDARNLAVAPGFIDTHSHTDRGLDEDPSAATQVSQGITTVA